MSQRKQSADDSGPDCTTSSQRTASGSKNGRFGTMQMTSQSWSLISRTKLIPSTTLNDGTTSQTSEPKRSSKLWQNREVSEAVFVSPTHAFRTSDDGTQRADARTQKRLERTRDIQQAVTNAIDEHRRLGHPIVVSRDGKVLWLQPGEY
jgi:hypothetical protein